MSNKTLQQIQKQIDKNPVIIYMKGTPDAPECGFSAKAVGYLKKTGADYAFVNVLKAPFIYEYLPRFAQFPTFPQIYIGGELIGGSDIVEAMYNAGELQPLLNKLLAEGRLAALKPPEDIELEKPAPETLVQLTMPE